MRKISVIGAACGYGAKDHGCQDGPEVLRALDFLDRLKTAGIDFNRDDILHLPEDEQRTALSSVTTFCEELALKVRGILADGNFPLVLGGDHSCAIGTWSGVSNSLPERARLGLIWIDAHMDSHTFSTSPSGAIHGMPLACLLGHGDKHLIRILSPRPKLSPESICLIGTRSFEAGEASLLNKLGVRIFPMEEITQRGFEVVWHEALAIVRHQTAGFGISLDLDALDPAEDAGVGTPEPGGLLKSGLIEMLCTLKNNPDFLAMEIVEYNPYLDANFTTGDTVCDLVEAIA